MTTRKAGASAAWAVVAVLAVLAVREALAAGQPDAHQVTASAVENTRVIEELGGISAEELGERSGWPRGAQDFLGRTQGNLP